jgi:hypothetical protein
MNTLPHKPLSRALVYSVAGPHVVTEVMDGELTLINLDSGHYFAAGGPAIDVWEIVSTGATAPDVDSIISARYAVPIATVTAEVMRLLQIYYDLGLITEAREAASLERPTAEYETKTWEAGWIEVYGDMKELLLLDPIHDVEDAGWPPVKVGKSS